MKKQKKELVRNQIITGLLAFLIFNLINHFIDGFSKIAEYASYAKQAFAVLLVLTSALVPIIISFWKKEQNYLSGTALIFASALTSLFLLLIIGLVLYSELSEPLKPLSISFIVAIAFLSLVGIISALIPIAGVIFVAIGSIFAPSNIIALNLEEGKISKRFLEISFTVQNLITILLMSLVTI